MAILPNNDVPQIYQGFNFGSYIPKPGSDVLTMVYANPGTMSTADGRSIVSTDYINMLMCDVSTVGINPDWDPPDICMSTVLGGIDVALTPADGQVGVPLYFYMMRRSDGKLALMASRSPNYGVQSPAEWTPIRQMHFSCVWKLSRGKNWNGLANFFQCIDNSEVMLSGACPLPGYQILPPSRSKTNKDFVSVAPFVVNDVRWITVRARTSSGGSVGTAYLYTSPAAERAWEVGQVNRGGDNAFLFMDVMPDSSGNIAWATYGDALLELHIQKYKFSDPT